MSYKDSKVWLRDGAGHVIGWDLEDINRKIDEFNSFPWAPEADFFQWLSWDVEDGNDYQGFAVYWTSKLMKDVHPIIEDKLKKTAFDFNFIFRGYTE